MLSFLITLISICLICFFSEASPLIMAILLTLAATIFGMITSMLFSKWIGVSLMLIFVGGVMISFLYVSSLSANMKLQNNFVFFTSSALGGLAITNLSWGPQYSVSTPSLSLFYNLWNAPSTLFLILYLLLALLIAVKLTESLKGALVKKF